MVGIYLSVWVRRSLLLHIRGVQVTCIGTGGFGYLGNKGTAQKRPSLMTFVHERLLPGHSCHCCSPYQVAWPAVLLVA